MTIPSIDEITRQMYADDLDQGFIRDGVYGMLPKMLHTACHVFERKQDREVFLMAALPVCATLMRGARMALKEGDKGLNIAVWIHAPSGIGKGVAGMAELLLEGVKEEARKAFEERSESHRQLCDRHAVEYKMLRAELSTLAKTEYEARKELDSLKKLNRQARKAEDSRRMEELDKVLKQCQAKPVLPPDPERIEREDIALPLYGNAKTARDYIEENRGHVLFFDTEADSLQLSSSDYGDLRLVIKQGIENEKSSQVFKSTGLRSWRSYISLMIAATDDQLTKFIQGPSDGLFSRFLFYAFEPTDDWISSEPGSGPNYEHQLLGLQWEFAKLYNEVKMTQPKVGFTSEQWEDHNSEFQGVRTKAVQTHSALRGCIHRLAKYRLRIAATLSVMQAFERGKMAAQITCDDNSWTASRLIVKRFERGLYDTWSLYQDEQLPRDRQGSTTEHQVAKVAAAKRAKELSEEGDNTLVQIHDLIQQDQKFTPYTMDWRDKVSANAKKQRVGRLLTFLQRDE